jgi:hypothetical protein
MERVSWVSESDRSLISDFTQRSRKHLLIRIGKSALGSLSGRDVSGTRNSLSPIYHFYRSFGNPLPDCAELTKSTRQNQPFNMLPGLTNPEIALRPFRCHAGSRFGFVHSANLLPVD